MAFRLLFCYNAEEQRAFEVERSRDIDEMYREYCYRLSLDIKFQGDGEISNYREDQYKELCSRNILPVINRDVIWPEHNSFLVVKYRMFIDDDLLVEAGEEELEDLDVSFVSNDSDYASESDESDDEIFYFSEEEDMEDASFSSGNGSMDESF